MTSFLERTFPFSSTSSTSIAQVIPSFEKFVTSTSHGIILIVIIVAITLVCEWWSLDTAKALYQKNKRLYVTAVALNLFNHITLGLPSYIGNATIILPYFNKDHEEQINIQQDSKNVFYYFFQNNHLHQYQAVQWFFQLCFQVLSLIMIHSLCFYTIHRVFHSYPKLYKWHKFHHLFNMHVPPLAANAVSPVEYFIGYVSPFLVGTILIHPSELAMWIAVLIIGICNIIMHTPKIESWYDSIIPCWMVGTGDHLEHHRRLNCHYAAPTFDVDWAVEQVITLIPSSMWTILDTTHHHEKC